MAGLTDADRRWGTPRAGQPKPRVIGRPPWMPPQDQRHHYVFLKPCGCPAGLVEASPREPGGPPRIADEGAAWDEMYDLAKEQRAARARGLTVVHVDHATYERDLYERFRSGCPQCR